MADSLPPHRFSELFSELRSIVSNDEFRSSMSGGGAAHQRDHIPCARRSGVHFQSQNLARKSVKYGRDEKGEPQNTNLRDVRMPNVIGLLRFQQVMRLDASGFFHRGSCFSRRLSRFQFPQHPLDAGPADLNSSEQQVPGHGAGSEFRFRAEPSQFLRRPAYGVIHAIPDDGPGQQARLAAALDGFNPCAERIFVDHEPLGGVFDIPVPQSHDLQNGQPLGGAVIGPLLWRHVLPPGTENFQFSTQQFRFRNFMIPLDHQSHNRRRGGSQSCPRQLHGLPQRTGHGVNQIQHSDGSDQHRFVLVGTSQHDSRIHSSRLQNKPTAHQEIRNCPENSLVAFLWQLALRKSASLYENQNPIACKTHFFRGIISPATGGIATDRESRYQWIIPSYFPSLSSEVRINAITASLIGGGSEFQFSIISDKSESRTIHGCAFCESIAFPTFSRSSFSPSGKHPPAKPPAMRPSSTARLVVDWLDGMMACERKPAPAPTIICVFAVGFSIAPRPFED